MARKNAQIKDLPVSARQQLAGVNLIHRANARFVDAHRLNWPLNAASRKSERSAEILFVIASGSSVAPSPLPDWMKPGSSRSDDAVALKKLPGRSSFWWRGDCVEFAQFFTRSASRSPHPAQPATIEEFDHDAAWKLKKFLSRRRSGFYPHKLLDAKRDEKAKPVVFEQNGREFSFPPMKSCSA